jgi:hypothetical protein
MLVYHTTFNAAQILAQGFRDGKGCYGTDTPRKGVWFSDRPLDVNEGAKGDTLLILDLPDKVFATYEWKEDGKPYREALIPAKVVNRYGRPKRDLAPIEVAREAIEAAEVAAYLLKTTLTENATAVLLEASNRDRDAWEEALDRPQPSKKGKQSPRSKSKGK